MGERQWGIVLDGQDGNHVFVHFSDILPDPIRLLNGIWFLIEGQKVAFDLFEFQSIGDSQRRTAKNVQILED